MQVFEGTDSLGSTAVAKVLNTYTITDLAGHTTKLTFQKTLSGSLLTLAKLTSIQYDNALPVTLSNTSLAYLWQALIPPPLLLTQTLTVNSSVTINAVYVPLLNKTTVTVLTNGVPTQTQVFTGLRVVKLTTLSGVVGWEL